MKKPIDWLRVIETEQEVVVSTWTIVENFVTDKSTKKVPNLR